MGEAALIQVVAQLVRELRRGEHARLDEIVLLDLPAVLRPRLRRGKVLQLHGLGLGEMLVALRHVQAIEPGLLRGASAVEEEYVGGDGGVGRKHAARQAHHGVQVEFREQLLLDVQLGIVRAEQEAVRQHHRRPSAGLQAVHHHVQEQVRRLAAGQVRREIVLHVVLLVATVGGIHQQHVEGFVLGEVQQVVDRQRVAVGDVGRVDAVEQQVGDAEDVGKLLLLDAVDAAGILLLIVGGLDLRLQLVQEACDEAARAAGQIRHGLADLRLDHLRHELRHRAGRVEFARGTGELQLVQQRFVDFPESVDFVIIIEVQLVDHVDDLPQQHAVLHVVVGVLEHGLHDGLLHGHVRRHRQRFQRREQAVVDEIKQRVASRDAA